MTIPAFRPCVGEEELTLIREVLESGWLGMGPMTARFEAAIADGLERASKTLDNITGAWINEMKVDVSDGSVTAYRVNMKVTFVLKD